MLFIKFDSNYADEFDVEGFMIVANDVWERYVNSLTDEDFGEHNEFYFGTNESLSFDDKAYYLSSFETKEVSDDELVVIKKFFGLKSGFIPLNEDKFYPEEDEEDSDEDE